MYFFSSSTEAVGGSMKRSSFDIHLGKDNDSMHILSVNKLDKNLTNLSAIFF